MKQIQQCERPNQTGVNKR